MKTAKLHVEGMEQETHQVGAGPGHMRSVVFYSFEYEGKVTKGLSSIVKQIAGGSFNEDPLEVSPPDYSGPFNYLAFRDAIEDYYRQTLNRFISMPGGLSGKISMLNGTFKMPRTYDIPINP